MSKKPTLVKTGTFYIKPQYDTDSSGISSRSEVRTQAELGEVMKRMLKIIEAGEKVRKEYEASNVVSIHS